MTASFSPIIVSVGSQVINKSVVPIIETQPLIINTYNMRPGACAHFWFDDVLIDNFIQPVSYVTVNTGFNAAQFSVSEGVYCPNTHAYGLVLETSQTNILHLNEDFTTINLATFGTGNTFYAAQYVSNDVVFLCNNTGNVYANVFMARVQFWDYSNGALVVSPLTGSIANTGGANTLYKVGAATVLSNVINIVAGHKFPYGSNVYSTVNVSKYFVANTYTSAHGLLTQGGSGSTIFVSGLSPTVNIVGQKIYIVRGTGIAQHANVTGYTIANGAVTLDAPFASIACNSYYGIGNSYVDSIGLCTAIFHVPSDPAFYFQTGNRLVTINDSIFSAVDGGAGMRGTVIFVSAGQLPVGTSATPVVPPTPQAPPAANTTVVPSAPTSKSISNNGNNPQATPSPLVQTFFTPKSSQAGIDYGCFATSVNLFFQNKPSGNSTQFPVTVSLVTTVNGFPTSNLLASSTVRYENINITDGQNTFPNSQNSSTFTKFSFDDPVYLEPGTEYGIILYTESPNYDVWVAQTSNTVVNGTTLISKAPYVGSFYEPQNASAWNPINNQQLMFVLNKAQFNTSPTTLTFNVPQPTQNVYMDIAALHSADLTFPVANIIYGLQATTANSGTYDAAPKTLPVDLPYYYGGDLVNSSVTSNRRRMISAGNANSAVVSATLYTTNPDISPVFHSEALSLVSFANIVNAGGLDPNSITIVTPGNHLNAANIVVTFSAPTGDGGITATGNVISLTGNAVTAINIINPGVGYLLSPTITITEAGAPANATAVVNGENSTSGGNGYARYVTRPITLAQGFNAGDLQVFLQAIRPQGTDVSVYYKVLSASDNQPISSKSWQLLQKKQDLFSPDQQTPISLTYFSGLNSLGVANGSVAYVQSGITYPIGGTFNTFQIKIVLTANDPTVPPEVQNMRAIAVPAG